MKKSFSYYLEVWNWNTGNKKKTVRLSEQPACDHGTGVFETPRRDSRKLKLPGGSTQECMKATDHKIMLS